MVEQGEEANLFYLIQSGTIRVERGGQVLRTLGKWDYFGERALLLSEKRSARCIAGGHTTVFMHAGQPSRLHAKVID